MPDPLIGSLVAGHRIERLVGRGGMGVVYAAVDVTLDRTVALKLIAPELAAEHGFRSRFIAESRIAASIDHPNVVPIHRAGEEDGVLFLAMRLVDGADLRTIVERDGPLAPERAAAILAQVAA
ncbi:MAG TPA: protein kinase, partial [Solirubrobacteraceae bacterium]|nr:protein kinase [Solirubrobacteraceae bacterium]